MTTKALIAMSGGVDSSVAAYLMKERGFSCTGVTMRLLGCLGEALSSAKSDTSVDDACAVAKRLAIPFETVNFSADFRQTVIEAFINAYAAGRTPNPCVVCNRLIKFGKLLSHAAEIGCDFVATGHYARIARDERTGRFILKKAVDLTKDQSYFLYSLTQKQLAHILFPLGELDKTTVRAVAAENGFSNAHKHDSQDICFIDGSYTDFIESIAQKPFPRGSFIDKDNNILGTHGGIIRYTIGQRKGLGVSFGEPMYVTSINAQNNTVTLGKHEELFSKRLIAENLNLVSVSEISSPQKLKARVRYRHTEQCATVTQLSESKALVEFDEPQRAVTPGQSVVFYDGDVVVGGGTISLDVHD